MGIMRDFITHNKTRQSRDEMYVLKTWLDGDVNDENIVHQKVIDGVFGIQLIETVIKYIDNLFLIEEARQLSFNGSYKYGRTKVSTVDSEYNKIK